MQEVNLTTAFEFAQDRFADAQGAVSTALSAAEASGQWPLYIKLSNNMGAVLKRLQKHGEAKELHERALSIAVEKFGADNVETYDTTGKLLSITSRAGVVQTMSYDGSGRLSSVTDNFGHQLIFSYDASGKLSSVTRQ